MSEGQEQTKIPIPTQVKAVLLGSWGCGKTQLLMRYLTDSFDANYTPSSLNNFSFEVIVSGDDVQVRASCLLALLLNLTVNPYHSWRRLCQFGVWDTPGRMKFGADELYKILPQTDVFVLCFNVARPVTIERLKHLATLAVAACPTAYFVVVGCAADLREYLKNVRRRKWWA